MFRRRSSIAVGMLALVIVVGLAGCASERSWTASQAKAALLSDKIDSKFAAKGYKLALANGSDGQPLKVETSTAAEQSVPGSKAQVVPAKCLDASAYAVAPSKDAESADPFFTSRGYEPKSYEDGGGITFYRIRVFPNASDASSFMKYAVSIRKSCGSVSYSSPDGQKLSILTAVTSESGDTAFSDETNATGGSNGDISNVSSWFRSGNLVVTVASSGNAEEGKPGVRDLTAILKSAAK